MPETPESRPLRRSDEPASLNRPQEVPVPSADEVQTQLERILRSPLFGSSESLRAFLRFTVQRTLEGRGDELKEYLLGVEVFRRGDQFDPRLDSIVRVQGSKVRAKLREYYETLGQDDPVWIEVPRGTYVPLFRRRTHPVSRIADAAHSMTPAHFLKRDYIRKRVLGTGLGLAVICVAFIYSQKPQPGSGAAETRLLQLTYDAGLTTDPAVSPDGKLVAYVSDRSGEDHLDLWIQPVQGGSALQLTHGPADVREPSFSPDGTTIVYRSDEQPGALCLISVLGGEPRRIASKGQRPRFSPDGQQIAYWVGQDVYGALYVLAATGGPPRRIGPEFNHATYPVWTPDGKHLLFWGNKSESYKDWDWWVVPLAGGTPVRTGLAKRLAEFHLEPDVRSLGDWTWFQNSLILSARQGDSTNLWRIPISAETFQITGNPRRLTFGAGQDALPAITPEGRIVFATLRNNVQIWSLPVSVNQGQVLGDLRQVTTDAVSKAWPSISADGRYLVFTGFRGGRQEIWFREMQTGQERNLTPGSITGVAPAVTHDGSDVAFGPPFPRHGERVGIYRIRTRDGVPEKICEECGYPTSWSHDKSKILYNISPKGDPSWLDVESGQKHLLVRHPVYSLWESKFSPDDRWVVFTAVRQPGRNQIFIVPFPAGGGSHETAWIPSTDGMHADSHVAWSPNGTSLYFVSDRDGRMCLWTQALGKDMRPLGGPRAVLHFHRTRRSVSNVQWNQFTLRTASDSLVFNMGELTGNIWMSRIAAQ